MIGWLDLLMAVHEYHEFLNFFLGWPSVRWYYTEKLAKPPKDWRPPSSLDRGSPAYIEVGEKKFEETRVWGGGGGQGFSILYSSIVYTIQCLKKNSCDIF